MTTLKPQYRVPLPLLALGGVLLLAGGGLAAQRPAPATQTLLLEAGPMKASAPEVAAAGETLRGYREATQYLHDGQDEQALARLRALRRGPLLINTTRIGDSPDDISPLSTLLGLGQMLARCADKASTGGDTKTALLWVGEIKGIAAHLLEADEPSLCAVAAACSLDRRAAALEARILRQGGQEKAARLAEARAASLRFFYQDEVFPALEAARAQQTAQKESRGGAWAARQATQATGLAAAYTRIRFLP